MGNPKTLLVLIMLFQLLTKTALGQTAPQVIPLSPEAAALNKTVDYPVNLNTGIPDINIPFYEINVGGLNLPVQLDYHAGGFRINEQATRAGLGWTVSSDLQITRTVNGLDDFKPNVGYIANPLTKAFYTKTISCPTCPYPLWSNSPFPYANAYELAMGEKDGMPDKFNYKLLGKSGSFYFQKNISGTSYTIVPVPFDNIQIQYNNGQFIITDSDGTKYYFGEPGPAGDLNQLAAQGREVSGNIDGGTCMGCVTTAWKCKKIENATGTDELVFSYTSKTVAKYRTYSDEVTHYSNDNPCAMYPYGYYRSDTPPLSSHNTYESLQNYGIPFYLISSPKYWVKFGNSSTSYLHVPYVNEVFPTFEDKVFSSDTELTVGSTNSVAGLALSEINFRGGKVVFNGADQLNNIRVLDSKNTEVKSLHFFHSFKQANYVAESQLYNGFNFQGTMYLDSLHLRQGSGTYERYALLYKDKFCYGNHLKGNDAWGYPNSMTMELAYANNVSGNILSIPTKHLIHPNYYFTLNGCNDFISDIPLTIGGNDWAEAVDESSMQRGILKRIIYPTGGFVDFDFEANRYMETFYDGWRAPELPQLSGGLRIRSISYYDAEDPQEPYAAPVSQKYYKYGDLEDGVGILVNRPRLAPEEGVSHFAAVSYKQQIAYLGAPWGGPPCIDRSCLEILAVETKTSYQSASALDYTYANSASIYYTKVTEYQMDLGKQTGKTVHEYYPPEEFYDYDVPLRTGNRVNGTNIPYLKAAGLMGALKSVTQYRALLGYLFEPVHRKSYTYTRYLRPQQVQVAYSFLGIIYDVVEGSYTGGQRDLYDNSTPLLSSDYFLDSEYIADVYGIPVGRLLMTSETDTFYNESGMHTARKAFTYDNLPYIQPSKITTTDSKGRTIDKTIRYPYNFSGNSVYDQMTAAARIAVPIEQIETNTTTGVELSRRRTDYQTYSAGFGFIAPASVQSSVNGKPLETELTFDNYDHYANILQTTARESPPTSYLWAYNGLYPVVELKGVNHASIPTSIRNNSELINPSTDAALRTLLNQLRSLYNVAHKVNTYTYKRLVGISSFTHSTGNSTYYEYDPVGRLMLERDHHDKIIKRYDYKTKGPDQSNLNVNHYANVPVLRTHYRECPGGIIQPYNSLVAGGTYIASNMDNAMTMTENQADLGVVPDDLSPCPTASNTAHLKIHSLYMEADSYPSRVDIDFIRDGSVVATHRVNHLEYWQTLEYDHIYLPAGEYQISVRPNADLHYGFASTLFYYFESVDEQIEMTFDSGQTVTLNKDKTYTIMVANL